MKKGYLNLFIYALIAVFILIFAFNTNSLVENSEITYSEFLDKVSQGDVEKVLIGDEKLTIYTYEDDKIYYTGQLENDELISFLIEQDVEFDKVVEEKNTFLSIILSFLPTILLLTFFFVMFNSLMSKNGGSGGIMSVGKNKSKMYMDKDTGVTFNDVAGEDEAKESLNEIIDYLHNTEKYTKIGAKLPKGVLLVGPPGTGKTLLAKAVAGEAKVPFFSLSGSDFVEMFVGVGASRVRDLFEDAKKHAPCIIFIDEIDAIGKARGNGSHSGGHDEREQTLNQLLTEMDGFETDKAVIVLAATNRPEVLDKALLRPGRFDRRVIVDKPDLNGRIATLNVHAKNVNLDETVDMKAIALATSGAVGADLANIINEAALNAVRKGKNLVSQSDIMEAVEVVFAGKEKKDRIMSEKERQLVAYHEVGHAVVAALQKNSAPVQKITIVPRTMGALGYTMQVPEEEKYLMIRDDILCDVRTLLGGRCAEEVFFGVVSTGASNDIERATAQIRKAITQYGMSDLFDMVALEDRINAYLDNGSVKNCSEQTYTLVDREINRIIKKLHIEAKQMLIEHKDMINEIANYLIEKENITGDEFMEIFRKYVPENYNYDLDNDSIFKSDLDFMSYQTVETSSVVNAAAQETKKTTEKIKPLAVINEPKKEQPKPEEKKKEIKPFDNKKEDKKTSDNKDEASETEVNIKSDSNSEGKSEIKISPLESSKKNNESNDKKEEKRNDLSSLLDDIKKKDEKPVEEPAKTEKKLSPFEMANQKKAENEIPEVEIRVEKKELPFEQPKKDNKEKKELDNIQSSEQPKPLNSSGSGKKKKKKNHNNQGNKDEMSRLMDELNSGSLKNEKKKTPYEKANSTKVKTEESKDDSDDDISEDMY